MALTSRGKFLPHGSPKGICRQAILTADKAFRLKDCQTHQSLKHITGPGIPSELSWLKIWDMEQEGLSFFSALSQPVFGDRLCPHCKLAIEKDHTYLEHLVETHQELQLGSVDEITNIVVSASPAIVQTGKRVPSLSSRPS